MKNDCFSVLSKNMDQKKKTLYRDLREEGDIPKATSYVMGIGRWLCGFNMELSLPLHRKLEMFW